jgi:hypothetical protein
VTYANLQQFIYGAANTASKTFPSSANEPFNFAPLPDELELEIFELMAEAYDHRPRNREPLSSRAQPTATPRLPTSHSRL